MRRRDIFAGLAALAIAIPSIKVAAEPVADSGCTPEKLDRLLLAKLGLARVTGIELFQTPLLLESRVSYVSWSRPEDPAAWINNG